MVIHLIFWTEIELEKHILTFSFHSCLNTYDIYIWYYPLKNIYVFNIQQWWQTLFQRIHFCCSFCLNQITFCTMQGAYENVFKLDNCRSWHLLTLETETRRCTRQRPHWFHKGVAANAAPLLVPLVSTPCLYWLLPLQCSSKLLLWKHNDAEHSGTDERVVFKDCETSSC